MTHEVLGDSKNYANTFSVFSTPSGVSAAKALLSVLCVCFFFQVCGNLKRANNSAVGFNSNCKRPNFKKIIVQYPFNSAKEICSWNVQANVLLVMLYIYKLV